jgi:hypothetical protein
MQKPVPVRSRKRVGLVLLAGVLLLAAGGVAVVFRQGVVPPALNPLPPVDLARPDAWLLDWRLASLRYDAALCRRVLASPHIEARPIPDTPMVNGCGLITGVRLSKAGGAVASFDRLTCQAAVALALWLEHEVQPLAQEILGQRVIALQSSGSYACRNIAGSRLLSRFRSQHALANALDVSGFVLPGGRRIGILAHWKGSGPEARFLQAVHGRACRYFRVVLGPEHNESHRDHFHFDRGPFMRCK